MLDERGGISLAAIYSQVIGTIKTWVAEYQHYIERTLMEKAQQKVVNDAKSS
jgi:hypothetical protein